MTLLAAALGEQLRMIPNAHAALYSAVVFERTVASDSDKTTVCMQYCGSVAEDYRHFVGFACITWPSGIVVLERVARKAYNSYVDNFSARISNPSAICSISSSDFGERSTSSGMLSS